MTWEPSSIVEEPWGWIQIVVSGVQRNDFRGVPTIIENYALEEPYTYGPATLTFPGITEWDELGVGDLWWLKPNANVELNHIRPDGTKGKTLWAGFIMMEDRDEGGCTVTCGGALSGRAGIWQHLPPLTHNKRDIGDLITRDLRSGRGGGFSWPYRPQFGFSTFKRGARSQTVLDFMDEMLAMAQTSSGGQWTIRRKPGTVRVFEPVLKDQVTLHAQVHAGARGVKVSLRKDPSAAPNVIYGEGVDPRGGRWGGTVYPNLFPETVPPYPYFNTATNVTLGTQDSAIDRPGQIHVWHLEMAANGLFPYNENERDNSFDEYGTSSEETCRLVQRRAGLPITGVLNYATWQASWGNGINGSDLSGARHDPLAYGEGLQRYYLSPNGSYLREDPSFDESKMRVDGFLSFGEGVPKEIARRDAERTVTRNENPGWYGTIELTSDPVEMSRFELEEGMNIRVRRFASGATGLGPKLHISGVSVSPESGAVVLTVDEKARDLLMVSQMIQRDREARDDPAKNILNQRRKSTASADSFVGWDSEAGAGVVPRRSVSGGRWTVIRVVGAQLGRLIGIDLKTTSPRKYAVAVFGNPVSGAWLDSYIGNPLVKKTVGSEKYAPFDVPSVQDDLDRKQFLEAWGGPEQAGGYWPGQESDNDGKTTHPLTGRLRDSASAEFVSAKAPWLWMAVYIDGSSTDISGRLYAASEE